MGDVKGGPRFVLVIAYSFCEGWARGETPGGAQEKKPPVCFFPFFFPSVAGFQIFVEERGGGGNLLLRCYFWWML